MDRGPRPPKPAYLATPPLFKLPLRSRFPPRRAHHHLLRLFFDSPPPPPCSSPATSTTHREMAGNGAIVEKDPLNWGAAAAELTGSHLDEVKRMVAQFREPVVKIEGASLRVGQVAAVAQAKDASGVSVELDEEARPRVKASSEWIDLIKRMWTVRRSVGSRRALTAR